MGSADVWLGLVGSVFGAAAALYGGRWSFKQVARESHQEQLHAEVAALRAADMEIAVAMEIARAKSPTPLPMDMLTAALPSIHHMDDPQRAALVDYSQQALRYNGRVARLVAFGEGKRAAGQHPGAEKPDSQAERVLASGPDASLAIVDHLRSHRFNESGRIDSAVPGEH